MLPADLRDGGYAEALYAASRGQALLLRWNEAGEAIHVDRRGRLVLPTRLRRLADPCGSVIVAARRPESSCIVVAPTNVLDGVVDDAAGEVA